jgi:hypothetical protein
MRIIREIEHARIQIRQKRQLFTPPSPRSVDQYLSLLILNEIINFLVKCIKIHDNMVSILEKTLPMHPNFPNKLLSNPSASSSNSAASLSTPSLSITQSKLFSLLSQITTNVQLSHTSTYSNKSSNNNPSISTPTKASLSNPSLSTPNKSSLSIASNEDDPFSLFKSFSRTNTYQLMKVLNNWMELLMNLQLIDLSGINWIDSKLRTKKISKLLIKKREINANSREGERESEDKDREILSILRIANEIKDGSYLDTEETGQHITEDELEGDWVRLNRFLALYQIATSNK